ncbi:hypothetical protein EH243_14405 [Amphritea opalescens]|uniref:DUF4823 domain-containing protein n=1 Tax=Amphritea opalescens TaxID=2490544 RepID=A0A430KNH2_9GAMM|nr:hypothetical protein [Amphritea opalescens]RTE65051.1 hypothetical protein EH243_14405 [Amphritea opalescens]
MLKKVLVLSVGSTLLAGCFGAGTSQAPIAATYPVTDQQKMQAAHHWSVLADHQADQLIESNRLKAWPLYIENEQETSFHSSYQSLLTSSLVSKGAHVQTNATGAATITYKVNVIEHKDREPVRAPVGALTALAAGVAVATVPFSHNWGEPALMLVPAAIYGDIFSGSWTSESNLEVVITTQAVVGNQVLYSSSNIYYINGGDSDHYTTEHDSSKPTDVTDKW